MTALLPAALPARRRPGIAPGVAMLVLVLVLGAVLSGCVVGPEYRRPVVETPADWRWKPAEPRDHVPRGTWWRVFADAQLDALEADAASSNPEVRAAMARVEQARAAARLTAADFYPAVQGAGTWARYRTSGNAPSPIPIFKVPSFQQAVWQMPIDLSYEIDLWGKVRRGFESSRALAVGAAAAQQFVQLTLEADVAATYFSLQGAQRQVDLLQRTIELRAEALELIRQRVAVGVSSEFEFERGRVEVESARAALAVAQQQRAVLVNALATLCGRLPAEFAAPAATPLTRVPEIAVGLPSALLERRPDVAEAERRLAARCAQIGVARAAAFPSVRLTAQGGLLAGEVQDLFNWESRIWTLGPGITVPLFQGGRNRANRARAQAAYEEGVALYRQQVLVAFRDVEDSLATLSYLREQVQARERAATAAAHAARIAYDRYRAGAVNFLEVVDAEQARLQSEVARVQVQTEQLQATVRLIKALGGGWEQDG